MGKVTCEAYTDRGIVGPRGKSAYEQAVEGGYTGTEEEFEAALASDINTVATNISDVNAVGANISDVQTVAGVVSDVSTVAGISSDVSAVSSNSTNISTVAWIANAVNNVASNESAILNVSDNLVNVNTIASNMNSVLATAGDIANIDAVAENKTNIDTVAGISSDVSAVASVASDISEVKDNATNINTVATNISDVNTVATNISNVNTAASNMSAIIAAPTQAANAATSASNAQKWAEGSDADVTPLGGTKSSKGWAARAQEIAESIGAIYKPAGSIAFASLPALSADVLGNVYNITDSFTTTADFVEGAGKNYPAGTNVAIVDVGTGGSHSYKFDILSGFVDLSAYRTYSAQDVIDAGKVNNTGAETIAGVKTFSDGIVANVTGDLTGTASNATSAVSATKATQDGDGNTISSTYIKVSDKGVASGVATLDANTKIPTSQIPDLSGTYIDKTTADQAITAQKIVRNNWITNALYVLAGINSWSWYRALAYAYSRIIIGNSSNVGLQLETNESNIKANINGTSTNVITALDTMEGATGSAAGTAGLVPAPAATDNTKFLRGDGTWVSVSGSLPSQTGNSGKFLTTDGTNASWAGINLPEGVYTEDNLVAGSGISFVQTATPTIASGFSNTDGIRILKKPFYAARNGEAWEFGTVIKATSSFSGFSTLLGCYNEVDYQGVGVHINNGYFSLHLNSSSSPYSWDIADNVTGTHAVSIDTWYYIKLVFTGTAYEFYYSLDKHNWVKDINITSSATIYPSQEYPSLGTHHWSQNSWDYEYFHGDIQFSNTYFKVDGTYVFNGAEAVEDTDYELIGTPTITQGQDGPVEVTNTGFHPPLFAHAFYDHELSDTSWLRADNYSWNDGTVYTNAYEHLTNDLTGATSVTTTIAGTSITYSLATDGHKIAAANMESAAQAIYNATGFADFYIYDSSNTRFKLPRWKITSSTTRNLDWGNKQTISSGFVAPSDGLAIIGGGQNDKNYYLYITPSGGTQFQVFGGYNNDAGYQWTTQLNTGDTVATNLGWSNESVFVPYKTNTSYAFDTYLYFYVGQFTTTALEETAGLNSSLFTAKADIDLSNVSSTSGFRKLTQVYINGASWYKVYAEYNPSNGNFVGNWCEQGGESPSFSGKDSTVTINLLKTFANTNYSVLALTSNSGYCPTIYCGTKSAASFILRREASSTSIPTGTATWRASGYIA